MIDRSIITTKIRKPPYATGLSLHDDRPPSRRGATRGPYSPLPRSYTRESSKGAEEKARSSTALLWSTARTSPEALRLFRCLRTWILEPRTQILSSLHVVFKSSHVDSGIGIVLRNFLSTPPQLFLACFEPITAPLLHSQPYQRRAFSATPQTPPKGENPHLRPVPHRLREKNLYLRSQTIHYFPFLKAL